MVLLIWEKGLVEEKQDINLWVQNHAYKRCIFFFQEIETKPLMKVICGREEKEKKIFGWNELCDSKKYIEITIGKLSACQ